ncbi:RDD family protein [Pontibacter ummariensis]|uniref:RDD family protein n=1 Tax=Pontibacter ummariensis TaxID=1610492 RepID=A0A239F136_9BACT|nr:RDD family protein [Pontibacter ummariensis]PRY12675.1 RDD family protein [Pontibacter ummariensis]SNS49872.1 RDD family protein [Pontibacter ummariensis]
MNTAYTLPAPTVKRSDLYGSPTIRFVASLVDTTLLVFSYSLVLYSMSNTSQPLYSWKHLLHDGINFSDVLAIGEMLPLLLYLPLFHWLYFTFLESSPKQATIGKFTLGLKVTDLRGKRISFAQANLRYFSKLLSVAPLCLGLLLILTTRRSQTLHDYIARTVVVTE